MLWKANQRVVNISVLQRPRERGARRQAENSKGWGLCGGVGRWGVCNVCVWGRPRGGGGGCGVGVNRGVVGVGAGWGQGCGGVWCGVCRWGR